MLKRLYTLVIAGAALTACSESSLPTAVVPVPLGADESVIGELTCRVDAIARSMSCAAPNAIAVPGRSNNLILGGQNIYVKLASTINSSTATAIDANVTVKNLTSQSWNTDSTGVTVDTGGVKVFFVTPPTSPVVISNATGADIFTAAGQKYFKYDSTDFGADGILIPGETSLPKSWVFTLNGATTFNFSVLIVSKMRTEQGTLHFVRDTLTQTQSAEYLTSVWGTSASDVWVGGGMGGPTGLQHWNGSNWTPAGGFCVVSPITTCSTNAIWGTASGDIWSVGTDILHYNGTAWSYVATPTDLLYSVWGSASNNIYAGGGSGIMYQYDGTTWSSIAQSATGLSTHSVTAIWGTSASNVYIGTYGGGTTGGLGVRRFNGTTWSTVSAGINTVRAIWGSSATDIYVGGDTGLLRHWNGSAWSTVSAAFGTNPASDAIFAIWGSSASNVYVAERNGALWHYNGFSWLKLTNTGVALEGLWGSNRDVFAVGYGTGAALDNIVLRGSR